MNRRLLVFLLAGSLLSWAQHGGMGGGKSGGGMSGGQGGSGSGMGSGSGSMGSGGTGSGNMGSGNMGSGNMGSGSSTMGPMDSTMQHQQPMTHGQMQSGSFQMLQQMTGMDAEHLQQMYAHSGAHDFGEFASAVVASHNMNLDQNKVMNGLKTMNLKQTLQKMGVPKDTAKAEVKKAEHQVKEANKKKS